MGAYWTMGESLIQQCRVCEEAWVVALSVGKKSAALISLHLDVTHRRSTG